MTGHRWTPNARDLGPGDVQTCERCGARRRREVVRRLRSVQTTAWAYEHRGRWQVLERVPECR